MTYDIVVVGGGTVALYLASLLPTNMRAALVVGSADPEYTLGPNPDTQGHRGALNGWSPGLGGTSRLWGGQLWPWRNWEMTGGFGRKAWPLDFERDVKPYYAATLHTLGLSSRRHMSIYDNGPAIYRTRLASERLETRYSTWMPKSRRNFVRNRLVHRRARDTTDFLPGHVTAINWSGRVADIRIADGNELQTVSARRVVLAAGTLNNIRLAAQATLGTATFDRVGRNFADHGSKRVAHLKIIDWELFSRFAAQHYFPGGRASARIASTTSWLTQTGLLPAYAHFEVDSGLVHAGRRAISALAQRHIPSADDLRWVVDGVSRAALPAARSLTMLQRPVDRYGQIYMRVDVEQPMRPVSTVGWTHDGSLKVRSYFSGLERTSADAFADEVLQHARELGFRVLAPVSEDLVDIYHLMGGTPMGPAGDTDRVVDQHLKVVGLDQLYIAGASVFPSGGMANPTLTALALTNRLAHEYFI